MKINARSLALGATLLVTVLFAGLFTGCKSTPSSYFFKPVETPVTNWVSAVTNTVYETNVVMLAKTNDVTKPGDLAPSYQIVLQQVPVVRERQVVEFVTNSTVRVSYEAGTNAVALLNTAGHVTDLFVPGLGHALTAAGIGLLGLIGSVFTKKRTTQQVQGEMQARVTEAQNTADNIGTALAYTIENYRDVLRKLPNGETMDAALISKAKDHQIQLGVAEEVLQLVTSQINKPEIQDASSKIAAEIERLRGTAPAPTT